MGGVTEYIYLSRKNFFCKLIFSEIVSTHTDSIKSLLKTHLVYESKFIPCYAVKKLQKMKLFITGVGVVIKVSLFRNFHTASAYILMFKINKFHKNLFL